MKAKNGVDDKHHRMDGNALRRHRETCSRSEAMEDHDSQPSQRRRHLMMMMMIQRIKGLGKVNKNSKGNFTFIHVKNNSVNKL